MEDVLKYSELGPIVLCCTVMCNGTRSFILAGVATETMNLEAIWVFGKKKESFYLRLKIQKIKMKGQNK